MMQLKIYNDFLHALPFAFKNSYNGANKNFHKLLRCIFEVLEFQINKMEEIRLKTFELEAKGDRLDYIASLFGLSRNFKDDETLLFEVYIAFFLKHNDGTNNWILSFVRQVLNPVQSFFIFENLEMIFYFQFQNHPNAQDALLLKKLKEEGIVIKVFYAINKQIVPIVSKEILPIYANKEKLFFNDKEAVAYLKPHYSIKGKPPLETAEFFIIEGYNPDPILSKDFIRLI